MVPRKGLEPSRDFSHYPLKVARLPIPPPGHKQCMACYSRKYGFSASPNFHRAAKMCYPPPSSTYKGTKKMTQTGHCHCGNIQLSFPKASTFSFSCHCSTCQKLVSGGRLLGFGIPADSLKITGEPAQYTYAGGSGKDIALSFCPKCSTQLFAKPHAMENTIVIRANALQNPETFTPEKFVFTDEGCGWDKTSL